MWNAWGAALCPTQPSSRDTGIYQAVLQTRARAMGPGEVVCGRPVRWCRPPSLQSGRSAVLRAGLFAQCRPPSHTPPVKKLNTTGPTPAWASRSPRRGAPRISHRDAECVFHFYHASPRRAPSAWPLATSRRAQKVWTSCLRERWVVADDNDCAPGISAALNIRLTHLRS